ncbi:MAG: phytanoyl-CoA dioxygenase family protein [Sphingobium sp.]
MALRLPTFLRWPLWVAELATGAKSFADNPLIGSRRLNSLGLHRLRLRAAAAMTAWRRRLLASGVSAEDRAAFGRQGFVQWDEVLPADAFERMRAGIMERAWPSRGLEQGHALTRRIAVDPEMLSAVPELRTLIESRRWRGLMRYVAATRAEPHYYIQSIFTHRVSEERDPQNDVHADTFHTTMKAWLFLTDVALEDGPLSYVSGSHRLTPERLAWEDERALLAPEGLDPLSAKGSMRIDRDELEALGLNQPSTFDVPANTLVVADTFGFHARAIATKPSVRVEVWAYTRRNPFLPWTGINIGNLPFLTHRRVALFWRLQDRFPKWLRGSTLPTGLRRPGEL